MRSKLFRYFSLSLAVVLLGSLPALAGTPQDLDRRAVATISGAERQQGVGYALAPAGDVNGDSIPDLIVRPDVTWRDDMPVYVVFGGSSDPISTSTLGSRGFVITHTGPGETGDMRTFDMVGVAAAGDVNQDGFDDVLVGVPGADHNERTNSGSVFVVFGKADTAPVELTNSSAIRIDGAVEGEEAGTAVATADIDGDAVRDVLIGAPFAGDDGARNGRVYVVLGSALAGNTDLAESFDGYRIQGAVHRQAFGSAVASAGDFDADGSDEIVVGAPSSTFDVASSAYVVYGDPTGGDIDLGSDSVRGFQIDSGETGEEIGQAVAGGGDFNGDGTPDVIVGAPRAPGPNQDAGAAFVIFGRSEPSDVDLSALGTDGVPIFGPGFPSDTGAAGSFVDDVTGDGRAEALIASPAASVFGEFDSGRVDLIAGTSSTEPVDLASTETLVTYVGSRNENAGHGLAWIPGFTGPSDAPLAIGAPDARVDDLVGAGKVYFVAAAAPANDLPPRATLLSYTARQRGVQDDFCWDGLCEQRADGFPDAEVASIRNQAVIRFGLDERPDGTALTYFDEVDATGAPTGEGRPLDHSIRRVQGFDATGYEVFFRLPGRLGDAYFSLQADWEGDDKGDSRWNFHLDLDDHTYTNILRPPAATLFTADERQIGDLLTYDWLRVFVDGSGVIEHADSPVYGFPAAKQARPGGRAYIRIKNKHRPDHLVIRSYRRVERQGEPPFVNEFPRGTSKKLGIKWRAVRRDGKTIAHDARFRLPRRGHHAYMEVRGTWHWHGTAPWQFHVRFGQ